MVVKNKTYTVQLLTACFGVYLVCRLTANEAVLGVDCSACCISGSTHV